MDLSDGFEDEPDGADDVEEDDGSPGRTFRSESLRTTVSLTDLSAFQTAALVPSGSEEAGNL